MNGTNTTIHTTILPPGSQSKRLTACLQFRETFTMNPNFHRQWIFTDECHVVKGGYVNKQNDRIWSVVDPKIYVAQTAHPERVTIWCGMHWKYGLVGPYYYETVLENEKIKPVMINGERYVEMLEEFVIPKVNAWIENDDSPDPSIVFQQDGAPCHVTGDSLAVLYSAFTHVITRNSPDPQYVWPPYSPDLAPCDAFFWGYLKDRIYFDGIINNIPDLKARIEKVFSEMPISYLKNAIDKFPRNVDACIEAEGGHFKK